AEVGMDTPELNFVEGPTDEQTQTGEKRPWGQTLASLFPFQINRFGISDGRIHFRNFHSTPPVDISMLHMSALATNLTNSRKVSEKLPAGVQAKGTTIGGGNFDFELHMNPMTDVPTAELTASVTNVDLVAMNDFLRAYGKFDVERGTFAM